MKKLYLNILWGYPKKQVYGEAHTLGRRLVDFLGKELFSLLLDSRILLNTFGIKKFYCVSDETYKLHPAAKALEGFLLKVIKGKKLQEQAMDKIGEVFGKKDRIVRQKIKDRKLIAKTKSVWDFCRNDVMHFKQEKPSSLDVGKKYDEIIELMVLLFQDFYGKSEPDEEIKKGFKKYFRIKHFKR